MKWLALILILFAGCDAIYADALQYYPLAYEEAGVTPSGLVAWWKFDGDLTDSEGGYDLYLATGAAMTNYQYDAGKFGQCLALTNVVTRFVSALTPSLGSNATVVGWVKLKNALPVTSLSGLWKFGDKSDTTHFPYSGTYYFKTFRSLTRYTITPPAWSDRESWTQIAITSESGADGWKMYENGLCFYTNTGESVIGLTGQMCVGADKTNGNFTCDGWIDDTQIYDTTLSASDIWTLYERTE